MQVRIAALLSLAGVAVSFLASVIFGVGIADSVRIVALACGAALVAGAVGTAVLRFAHGSSIQLQSAIVALTSVAAVAAAMTATSHFMFRSSNENAALASVLIVSGTIGALVSLLLGTRIDADRRRLLEATRQVARGRKVSIDPPATEEFAEVAQELEQMSVRLEETQARERALDHSRRELVAWISHDLRTPLARLRAVVEALEDDMVGDPETVRSYYRTINVETRRLHRLIDDLFELSRISAGALELRFESLRVAELVSDVVASARELAAQKGVQVDLQIESRPVARISPSHIERAFGNLLDNAIRHTAAGDAIRVIVGNSSDSVMVAVEDSCGGIASAELARLVDPSLAPVDFHAVESHPGLGVIIARGLVEAHEGSLSITNIARGCRFTIEIPRHAGEAANR